MGIVDEGEHAVVVALGERVVLVVVTLRALNREAQNGLADRVHAVEHRLHPELLGIGSALGVDHRIAQEAGGYAIVLRRSGKQVSGDLLDDESVVGHVCIECADHPVAIEPDLTGLVFFEAVGVGVPRCIEPDASPPLAVVRRGKQSLYLSLVSARSCIPQERRSLCWRRRQTGEVQAESTEQSLSRGARRRRHALGIEFRKHEGIDRTPGPITVGLRLRGARRGNEGPVSVQALPGAAALWPSGPLLDPSPDGFDLRIGELAAHRHLDAFAQSCYTLVEAAGGRVARHDSRPARPD